MNDLHGKTAVITGAASGIGKAMAQRFATAGMAVVACDVEEPALAACVADLEELGGEVVGVNLDVADADAVDAMATQAIERFGAVHVVCNNAGVGGRGLTAGPGELQLEDWQWVMGVNFWGVVNGHRSFLPHMLANGEGHIVNTASMAGHLPSHSAYGASKWAVVGITEGLHNSLAGSGVGVSCLCPGWVNTQIGEADRNRPEWAAGNALDEPSTASEAGMAFIREQLASGMDPSDVADLVHDAVVNENFWIFTDMAMVSSLQPRFDHVLAASNPTPTSLFKR